MRALCAVAFVAAAPAFAHERGRSQSTWIVDDTDATAGGTVVVRGELVFAREDAALLSTPLVAVSAQRRGDAAACEGRVIATDDIEADGRAISYEARCPADADAVVVDLAGLHPLPVTHRHTVHCDRHDDVGLSPTQTRALVLQRAPSTPMIVWALLFTLAIVVGASPHARSSWQAAGAALCALALGAAMASATLWDSPARVGTGAAVGALVVVELLLSGRRSAHAGSAAALALLVGASDVTMTLGVGATAVGFTIAGALRGLHARAAAQRV